MPWSGNETGDLTESLKQWISIRKSSVSLRKGNYRTVLAHSEDLLYIFSRTFEQETSIIIVNNGGQEREIDVKNMIGYPIQDVLTGKILETIKINPYEGRTGRMTRV